VRTSRGSRRELGVCRGAARELRLAEIELRLELDRSVDVLERAANIVSNLQGELSTAERGSRLAR
jgi:predicted nucleic acid-binding protein